MNLHEKYILRCLFLAELGKGDTESNPMVGAVLVYKDRIIGEGYHEKYGEAHAEVNCLQNVKEEDKKHISQATLYVSLEPCNHKGKTPPCSHAIIEAGIKKVVIGTTDNNPLVNNSGIQYLKNHQVEVIVGVCEKECRNLNKVFFTNHSKNRTFIKLKWSQSLDGFIGDSTKEVTISTQATNVINHKYRTEVDGILVGYNTALLDEPSLNVRHWQGKQPARIFLDWELKLPHRIIYKKGFHNIVLTTREKESTNEVRYLKIEKNVTSIAESLYKIGINSLLVEGGAKTHQLFIDDNIWDEAIIIKSDKNILASSSNSNNLISAATLNNGALIQRTRIAKDQVEHYSNSEFKR
jgi:diaminohydroxyphosphoribosylaminopyrimidine deaminase/5-amino-6-(5-phosphoribosylamino)uracil reductase